MIITRIHRIKIIVKTNLHGYSKVLIALFKGKLVMKSVLELSGDYDGYVFYKSHITIINEGTRFKNCFFFKNHPNYDEVMKIKEH